MTERPTQPRPIELGLGGHQPPPEGGLAAGGATGAADDAVGLVGVFGESPSGLFSGQPKAKNELASNNRAV